MYLECTMEGDSVVLTWTFEDDTDVVGYNVYRSSLDDIETPEDLHRRLAERSEFSVERALTERAGLGERGGGDFVRLNDELVQECWFTDDAVTDGARYAYMVTAVLMDGTESCLGPEEILVRIGSDGLALACPTPNPFTGRAAIAFSVPGGQPATLAVYTPGGRLVRRLDSSSGRAVWDGRSSQGALVAPGVYLVRLTSEGMSAEQKVVFLR